MKILITSEHSRSRLYSLSPEGIGTEYAESLTGYILRLAENHGVTPATLIAEEILPLIRSNTNTEMNLNHPRAIYQINEMNISAEKWAVALETLTCRKDLKNLTFLPWKGVFHAANLISSFLKWCPFCLNKFRDTNETIYYPLLWSINIVNSCPLHSSKLISFCINPRCGKKIPVFSSWMKVGYCPFCGEWLGQSVDNGYDKINDDQEEWISATIGEIIKNNPTPDKITRKYSDRTVFNALAEGGFLYLTRVSYLSLISNEPVTVINDLRHKNINLYPFLKVCYMFQVNPFVNNNMNLEQGIQKKRNYGMTMSEEKIVLLFKNDREAFIKEIMEKITRLGKLGSVLLELNVRTSTIKHHCLPCLQLIRSLVQNYKSQRKEEAITYLENVAKDPEKFQALEQIAKLFGYTEHVLLLLAPETCKKIVSKNKIQKIKEANEHLETYIATVLLACDQLVAQGIFPKKYLLDAFLEKPGILRNKKISKAYEEYARHLRQNHPDL